MAEPASARDMANDDLALKVDLLLARCRIQCDINQAMKQGEMSKNGPFSIDRNVVPVEFYQRSLLAGDLDATTVLSDIARLSGWREPVYKAVDYYVREGFQCSVEVRGKEMAAEWRGWNPKLAESFAAATFLKFLGFAINVDSSVLPGWSNISDQEKLLGYAFGETRTAPVANTPEPRPEIEMKTSRSPERSLVRMERLFRRLTRTHVSISKPPGEVGGEPPKKIDAEIQSSNPVAVDTSCNKPSASASKTVIDKPNKIVIEPVRPSVWDRLEKPRDEMRINNSRSKNFSRIREMDKPTESEDKENSSTSGLKSKVRRKRYRGSKKLRDERPIGNSILKNASSIRAIDKPKEEEVKETSSLRSDQKLEERKRCRDGDGQKFVKKLKPSSSHPHRYSEINEMDVRERKEPNVGRGINRKYSEVASTSESDCDSISISKNSPDRKKVRSRVSMATSYCRFNEGGYNIQKKRISPSRTQFSPAKCSRNISRVPSSKSESDSSSEHISEPRYYTATGFGVTAEGNAEERRVTGLNSPQATCSKNTNNDIQVRSKTKKTYCDGTESESESSSSSENRSILVKPFSRITPTKDCLNKLARENQPTLDLIDGFIYCSSNSNEEKRKSEVRMLEEMNKSHESDIDKTNKTTQLAADNDRPNELVGSSNCQLASGSQNVHARQIQSNIKKECYDITEGESESSPEDRSTLIPRLIQPSPIINTPTEYCISKAVEESQTLVDSNIDSSSKSDKNSHESENRALPVTDEFNLKCEGNLDKTSTTLAISSIKSYIKAYKKEARKHIIKIGEKCKELSQSTGKSEK